MLGDGTLITIGKEEARWPGRSPATLLKLWVIGFGAPGRVYVGTIPGGLFVSEDGGEHFELNRSLWNHESRGGDLFEGEGNGKTHWFGTPASEGGEFAPGVHSIDIDPRDPERIRVAISTAGVLESRDACTVKAGWFALCLICPVPIHCKYQSVHNSRRRNHLCDRPRSDRGDVDGDIHRGCSTSRENTLDWADVGIVAAPCDGDMIGLGN